MLGPFDCQFESNFLLLYLDCVFGIAAQSEIVFEACVSEVHHHQHVVAGLQTLLVDDAVACLRRDRLLLQHFAVRIAQQNIELVLILDVAIGRHHPAGQLVESEEKVLLPNDAEGVLPVLSGPLLVETASLPVVVVVGDVVVLEGPLEGSHVHVEESLAVSVQAFGQVGLLLVARRPSEFVEVVPETCVLFLADWVSELDQLFFDAAIVFSEFEDAQNSVSMASDQALVITQA